MARLARTGFSLIDALIALSILGVVAVVGAARVTELAARHRLRQGIDELRGVLEEGVMGALQREETLALELGENGGMLQVATGEEAGTTLRTVKLPRGVQIDSAGESGSTILFYPSGVASPATVTMRLGGRVCDVVLSLRGRVRTRCG